jgi:hypothetical protein
MQSTEPMRHTRNTFILIAILLAVCLLSALGYGLTTGRLTGRNALTAEVQLDGKTYGEYPLSKDTEVVITSDRGTNKLVIKDGQAAITEATCPDKICVHTGWISETGQTIVCMPNRVSVTIK